ncbi:hypothetical protein [Shewanella sp.]|uniref:hypothetical protein n=1 Tax=Shewanella sp. TaxID=50422 RepID=UPI004048E793
MENKSLSITMNTYSLRLDEKQDYKDLILQMEEMGQMFVVKHQGKKKNNPHFHFAIQTDVKKDAYRKRLKKIFTKGSGNGHMSLKDWDGEMLYIQYLTHECKDINELKDNILINTIGYDDATLVDLLARSRNIVDGMTANNPVNVVQKIIVRLTEEKVFKPTPSLIFHMIMEWYGKQEGKWYPNRFQMDNYIMYILGQMSRIADAPSGGNDEWTAFKERMWYKYGMDNMSGEYQNYESLKFQCGLKNKNLDV